ncbi:hypothetical protein BGW36DRAFT_15346 [Talaromyces proteolyticus]|uniref:RED-like N-terminal domain-containing protein n=1 Tax=Talaromyces proteolyticus TaxID=1131652 RepID=A0AAD4Q6E7_9EURO|nr:uncharacterized protein BGW36DRAFT_15346 [Talaromyces proteolyticus]KAH8705568.1 hypothetical protein BGW36DRAFT_15346 [Talaromyces proteolyticus]
MNNEQFRRLVLDQPGQSRQTTDSHSPKTTEKEGVRNNANTSALGSRLRSSIPMTPRAVHSGKGGGIDFARQLAEQRRETEEQGRPTKRFKASAAPKGTKLVSGYQDRTALRKQEEHDEDNAGTKKEGIEQRLKALEEMVKLGQIDQSTFDKLRRDLGVGGDLQSTHLVKGLDWDLLRRVRGGEDLSKKEKEEMAEQGKEEAENVDEELDRVLEKEVDQSEARPKEKKVKKGNLAAAPPAKRSRDEILRQLRESRAAAAAEPAPESTLGSKFKKIHDGKPEKKRWIETDPSGRRKEILVITDAEGNSKRKVRWLDKEPPPPNTDSNGLLLPDQAVKPLGMEVPAEIAAKIAAEKAAEAELEDEDIFADAGTDYNPLADLDEKESSDEDREEDEVSVDKRPNDEKTEVANSVSQATRPRNYFGKTEELVEERGNPLTSDPTLLAALKRAAALRQGSPSGAAEDDMAADDDVDPDRLAHRKKFLEEARRREAQDALDIDYGFGSSRIEDEEDEEGPTYDEQRGGNKRKRGPKKRKGDKDSAADVLRVMEGRNST